MKTLKNCGKVAFGCMWEGVPCIVKKICHGRCTSTNAGNTYDPSGAFTGNLKNVAGVRILGIGEVVRSPSNPKP